MIKILKTSMVLVAALAISATACGKKDKEKPADKPAAKPTDKPADEPKPLTAEQVVERVKQCWAWVDAKDEAKFATCYGPKGTHTMVDSAPPMAGTGPQEVIATIKPYWTAFPDIKHSLQNIITDGNNVAVVYLATGTNSGEMMGMPATNKKVGVLAAQAIEIAPDGTVAADRVYVDQGTIMGQLGVSSAPHFAPVIEALAAEPTVVIAAADEKEKANLAVVAAQGEAFNAHDVDKVMETYADGAVFNYVPEGKPAEGKEAMKKSLSEYLKMSSDVKGTVSKTWAAGDYVVMEATSTGTNDGDMEGFPKTGKQFTVQELHVLKLADGKIAEHWIFANSMAFAVQLGLIDPSKGPGAPAEKKAN